jgi:alpha-galactosidase
MSNQQSINMLKIPTTLAVYLFVCMGVFCQNQPMEFHKWALRPPMGWNSYDCFGAAVNEAEVKGNADIMAAHLKDAGWEYIVIDYCWYYPHVAALNNPPQTPDFKPSLPLDEYGRLLPAPDRFPSAADGAGFKAIGEYIHGLGLKFGIHVMRGIPREAVAKKMPIKGTEHTADQVANTNSTCRWLNLMYGLDMSRPGAQEYYNSLFDLYASWGVDYVKVDDISSPYYPEEIEAVRKAIDNCGRKIVLSLSPGNETPGEKAEHVKQNANLWRISSDFWDAWPQLKEQFELLHTWEDYIAPGHWPDADMIPIGLLNRRGPGNGNERRSGFTPTEQFTLMTLWCIARSPLMYGGDLMMMRPTELILLSNKEVLQVNQASLNNLQLFRDGNKVAWMADVPDSDDRYLAMFNLGDDDQTSIEVKLEDLGIKNQVSIRDLWKQEVIGTFRNEFAIEIEPHGSGLYRVTPK